MKAVFEQPERILEPSLVFVYENVHNEVYIGDMEELCIAFNPDEAILFAKEVIKIANRIKREQK